MIAFDGSDKCQVILQRDFIWVTGTSAYTKSDLSVYPALIP